MALIYRAIWRDDSADLEGFAATEALRWLNETKGIDLDALPDDLSGTMRFDRLDAAAEGPFDLTTRRSANDGVHATRMGLHEVRPASGQQWTTTLTVLHEDGSGSGSLWVDVERVSDDPYERVAFRAPRLVRNLIERGSDPRVGHVRLEREPRAITAAGLAGLIRNVDRRLPLVVFSHDIAGIGVTKRRARAAFDRLVGVAQVYVLPPAEVDAFKAAVGEELAVWGGAARLYLPAQDHGGLRPGRHRYVPGYRMAQSEYAASDLFVALLAATVPATPPPSAYERVRRGLAAVGVDQDLADLLEHADGELREKDAEIQRLRAEIDRSAEELLDLQVEVEDLESEINRKSDALGRWFASRGGSEAAEDLPAEVTSVADAIEWAAHLDGIVLHPDAPRDIDKLETAVNSTAWANAIWRGLRALNEYALSDEGIAGGFWEWCLGTTSPWSWPATSKKLAIQESETVMNDDRLRRARTLPVSTDIARRGAVEMVAHIKISEGGGPLAPRIYFLDDTSGRTKKVHVGFVGPHEHMPNKGTN